MFVVPLAVDPPHGRLRAVLDPAMTLTDPAVENGFMLFPVIAPTHGGRLFDPYDR